MQKQLGNQNIYLENIIAQMVNYSQLNFEQSLDIVEDDEINDLIPGLAMGVNILGEELQHKVKELKNLNEKLAVRNSFIKSVTHAVPEVIFVFNLQSQRITYVNKCASHQPDHPCPVIAIQKTEPCKNCRIADTIAEGKKHKLTEILNDNEIKMTGLNQEVKWYKTTSNNFEKDSTGFVTSILQTLTDITPLKEKEIQLLKKEEAIIQSLREKELLLQEVHHRVKNNLQIISGLLTLQINRANSNEVISQLTEIRSRILSISLIHEELYQSETLARIDVSKYCVRLCNNLAPVYANDNLNVQFKFDVDPNIFWSIDKATPLGLIINEVICNCYKHAFLNEQTGIISIKFQSTDQHYILEIKDNGKNPIVLNVNSSGKKTLGGKLISGLVMQLEASLKITTNDGYGIILTIPKEQ